MRNRQIDGVKFRRQERIGPFIVDFCSMELKLVIELDGGQHAEREAEDTKRTKFLQRAGYRVIRFWNHEVSEDTDRVVEQVADAVACLQRR